MENQSTVTNTLRGLAVAWPGMAALQLTTAALLGFVMLYGVGFLETAAVHSVAHDMRHAMGFPCH